MRGRQHHLISGLFLDMPVYIWCWLTLTTAAAAGTFLSPPWEDVPPLGPTGALVRDGLDVIRFAGYLPGGRSLSGQCAFCCGRTDRSTTKRTKTEEGRTRAGYRRMHMPSRLDLRTIFLFWCDEGWAADALLARSAAGGRAALLAVSAFCFCGKKAGVTGGWRGGRGGVIPHVATAGRGGRRCRRVYQRYGGIAGDMEQKR